MKRLLLCSLLGALAYAADAPKLVVYPKTSLVERVLMPRLKKCTAVNAVAAEGPKDIQTGQYLLDMGDGLGFSTFKLHGKLYNNAGEELARFDGIRWQTIVHKTCIFFEGLKAAQLDPPATNKQ